MAALPVSGADRARLSNLTHDAIGLDRKILSDLAISDETAFKGIVEQVKAALDKKQREGKKKAA